jgi:hypothetical protein
MGKTRKDHYCHYCKQKIQKGTDTSEIVRLSEGVQFRVNHGRFGYYWFFHKECWEKWKIENPAIAPIYEKDIIGGNQK